MGELDVKTVIGEAQQAQAQVHGMVDELNAVLDELSSHMNDRRTAPGMYEHAGAHPHRRAADWQS